MTTPTTNYSFPKPIVGGDASTWGTELNTALDDIDATIFEVSNAGQSAVQTVLDTGAANAYAIAPATPLEAYAFGLPIFFTVANANTAASTMSNSGLSPRPLVRRDGTALVSGDVVPGIPYAAVDDGMSYRIANLQTPASSAAAGILALALAADVLAGTDAAKGVTPASLVSSLLATNGYIKLPGGLIIQWGITGNVTGGGGTATITYPTPFVASTYAVVLTPLVAGTSPGAQSSVSSTTNTQFSMQNGQNTTGAFYWAAIGK